MVPLAIIVNIFGLGRWRVYVRVQRSHWKMKSNSHISCINKEFWINKNQSMSYYLWQVVSYPGVEYYNTRCSNLALCFPTKSSICSSSLHPTRCLALCPWFPSTSYGVLSSTRPLAHFVLLSLLLVVTLILVIFPSIVTFLPYQLRQIQSLCEIPLQFLLSAC